MRVKQPYIWLPILILFATAPLMADDGYQSLVPVDSSNFEQVAAQERAKAEASLAQYRQAEIAKANEQNYVLHMDGKQYGHPETIAAFNRANSMAVTNADGSQQVFGDGKGNLITPEQFVQEVEEWESGYTERNFARLEELTSTSKDKNLIEQVRREVQLGEKLAREQATKDVQRAGKMFVIPNSWSAEKMTLYHKAKTMGITLFEDGDLPPQEEAEEAKKEPRETVPSPETTTPKVLVSHETSY